jgi:tetratricopeptide (TPR) repeat protein
VNAERFAEVTYMTLKDKKNGLNQEGEEVASGAYNFADVIFRQKGNLVRAGELARESLRIRTLLYGNTSNCVGLSCNLLAKILGAQNKLKESIELFERALSVFVKFEGKNSPQYAAGKYNLGNLRQKYAEIQPTADLKRQELQLSDSNFKVYIYMYMTVYTFMYIYVYLY